MLLQYTVFRYVFVLILYIYYRHIIKLNTN